MKFNNPEVAEKFECLATQEVGLAGLYSGKLSEITLEGAEKLISENSPHLKRKEDKPKASKGKDKTEPPSTSTEGVS